MDRLQTLTWQYVAGRVEPADLPMAAARPLVTGFDSPALGRATGVLPEGTRFWTAVDDRPAKPWS